MKSHLRAVWALTLVGAGVWFAPASAEAYATMVRHGYTGCATCHADPSGGGVLTPYGRAQGVLLMAQRWDGDDDEAAVKQGELLFGAVPLPEELMAGGDLRAAILGRSADEQPLDSRFILMTADLGVAVVTGRLRTQATVGVATDGAFAASVVGGEGARFVSRTHWAGFDLGEERNFLLRAGRMNLPFGVRILEHTAFVRSATRTDVNAAQQHGVALAYSGESIRAEVMAILGNFQLSPDAYRDRGASAYLEYVISETATVGGSAMVTHAELDSVRRTPMFRHAYGAFARVAPEAWLAFLAEVDLLLASQQHDNAWGVVGFLQADAEPVQGLHVIGTLELLARDMGELGPTMSASAGLLWFAAPHLDLRVDGSLQSIATGQDRVFGQAVLGQVHAYL